MSDANLTRRVLSATLTNNLFHIFHLVSLTGTMVVVSLVISK